MERSDSHQRCGELWLSLVRRPHRRPLVDADGSHRFRNGPFGRDVVQAPGGASGLSHDETRCAAFAGAGASSASATCLFRESIPHPVQPLSTLRTPRRRDARKTRSRPACSALNGPDFHWQAHSSFPLAPRIRLSDKTSRLRPRHVVPKPAQTYEPEVPVEVREWIAPARTGHVADRVQHLRQIDLDRSPSFDARGRKGSIRAHSSSVKSLGYRLVFFSTWPFGHAPLGSTSQA